MRHTILLLYLVVVMPCITDGSSARASDASDVPLRVVVMDPLSNRLACDCVAGYAQRKYERLASFLQQQLGRSVELAFTESLRGPHAPDPKDIDVIIGKFSVVRYDARRAALDILTLAMLTGKEGTVSQKGLFVVRHDDPAKSVADLSGRRILFGPEESHEKHIAALATLDVFGVPVPDDPPIDSACSTAAVAVVEREADAAVISSYAMPLLQGCGTIDKGDLRIVGETALVPFIGVFVTERVAAAEARSLWKALDSVQADPDLLAALESKRGFVPLPDRGSGSTSAERDWTDWRGAKRDAISRDVPDRLPAAKRPLWSRILTGHGLSGLVIQGDRLIVTDKSLDGENDIFRCLDADTGAQVWMIEYAAPGKMDFTNSPRATPVIHKGLVYLLGAYGQLHCVSMDNGRVVWKRNLAEDFAAKVPTWGYCSTPLVVDDKLIVNPGAREASLAALDCRTGETVWTTPGDPPGYSCFVLAKINGQRQIIGYEAAALCGWDPETGKRLWHVVPEIEGDFNVPTPIVVGERLLVSTENNGTRLYGFDDQGRILPDPLAQNDDLSPDTSTPVAYQNLVLGNYGGLVCLDLQNNLETLWETGDDPYFDYCSFIAGNGRFLVTTQTGAIRLLEVSKIGLKCVSELDLFEDVALADRDVWSHPALVGNRLYIRNSLAVYCFLLDVPN